ncbi:MAG: TetR/AcrR family transcriptional regulator [Candidatus Hydrogenedentota bacterium]|nr:MAG: TetR/AcrR family transcriptional regulator [Candidatus Hydrogenedentota bacterium]
MRKEQTRERFKEAARKLCSQKGFYRVQVSDITKEAGLSTGSFYLYFSDKDSILYEILDDYFESYIRNFKKIQVDLTHLSLAKKLGILRRLFRFSLEYNLANSGVFLTWYRHGFGVSETIDKRIQEFLAELETLLVKDIRGFLENRVDDPHTLAKSIIGMNLYLSHQLIIEESKTPLAKVVKNATQLIGAGLMSYYVPTRNMNAVEKFAEKVKSSNRDRTQDLV